MEAYVAVLRPKQHGTVSQDFHARSYDVLLMDMPIPNTEQDKVMKKLPKTIISFEEEPADAIFTFLYNLTGSQMGGIKTKRAMFVPVSNNEPLDDSKKQGTLYCVPVDNKETLRFQNLPHTPGFFALDLVLESLETDVFPFSRRSKIMLYRLESWLREKHSLPGVMGLLFSVCTEDRLRRSIINPAYFSDTQTSLHTDTMGEDYSRTIANEALAKMMAIEKCDITIINPLCKSDQSFRSTYQPKVDKYISNTYWGRGKPDYTKIERTQQQVNESRTIESQNWVDDYPLHKCAYVNDAVGIQELLQEKNISVSKKDRDSWAAIHYAAWFGHLKAISVLLNEGECNPNIANDNGSTPLHLAASRGKEYVVELLLVHPDIDVNAVDKFNKTAKDLCESVDKPEWQHSAKLLQSATSKPIPTIQVFLMDGTFRTLNLATGANTTVQQLHTQMMRDLDMPEGCGHFFTIWICSRNLQLQLKPDHKPIQHLNDWKRKIVSMLTDMDPSREDPQLFWRRDAILSILEEKKVKHPVAVNLLFHEAYHNYIKSLYPCADGDAIILGGIIMQIHHGDYDQAQARVFFSKEKSLTQLVPMSKVQNRSINWASKIQAQYKHYSGTMADRDRSQPVLQHHFLTICWNLTVYGSAFFTGYVQVRTARGPTTVYIGVNDIGVHIINAQSKSMMQSFSYKDIEWAQRNDQRVLEIKLKGNSKGGMCILTKQAGMVNHLMGKLSQLNTGS